MNGNSFRLGVSGSGKSFSAKEEIVHLALSTDDDILILDPESEFTKLVEALGGQVVKGICNIRQSPECNGYGCGLRQ